MVVQLQPDETELTGERMARAGRLFATESKSELTVACPTIESVNESDLGAGEAVYVDPETADIGSCLPRGRCGRGGGPASAFGHQH